ncbi:unnamed protein product [Paramecium primaurelia]|uniref:Uncharacterized protein n=1 Tax=Paramecium primaurelia TaxID=5886 RepID=A0A8S1KC60_PARPR|nr:unnamed protein product [Paramecium primaurelia]
MILQELEGESLYWYGFLKTKFFIIISNNKTEIKYATKDGQIMRIDYNKDPQGTPQILYNLEQIKYLQWVGQYGENLKKVGNWVAIWKGHKLKNVGGKYSEEGKKIGFWVELSSNFMEQSPVYEVGEYVDDQRRGQWKYLFKDYEVGGGNYNEKGIKNENWIELSKSFTNYQQVTYNGKYKNGKKIGLWVECLRMNGYQSFKVIGEGYYDKEGKELKIGSWVELIDLGIFKGSQITFNGLYNNGQKIGRWNKLSSNKFSDIRKKIGGGQYDERGLKNGKWVEFDDHSDRYKIIKYYLNTKRQITYCGEYKNGQKVGLWNLFWNHVQKQELIGGGCYEIKQGGLKNGKWIETSDNVDKFEQITYNGVYKDGKKIGKWDIFWRELLEKDFHLIGGGSYNEIDLGKKEGKWKELSLTFSKQCQIIFDGEYKNNQRIGRWNTYFRRKEEQFNQIGGGDYNSENGLKQGKWIDLFDNFRGESQVTYNGEYKNGQRVGKWDIYFQETLGENQEQIGGGSYDLTEGGIKNGIWIELSETFQNQCQVIYQGEYQNGIKVGKWEEKKRDFYAFNKNFLKRKEYDYEY